MKEPLKNQIEQQYYRCYSVWSMGKCVCVCKSRYLSYSHLLRIGNMELVLAANSSRYFWLVYQCSFDSRDYAEYIFVKIIADCK